MSLLDSGPDQITITPAVWGTDDDGNQRWLPGTTPRRVWGTVESASSITQIADGQSTRTIITFITRNLPAISSTESYRYSEVEFNAAGWHCLTDPTFYRRGAATRHVSITLEADS